MLATRAHLDLLECPNGCMDHPIYLNPVCHPDAAINVSYDRRSGTLHLTCEQCGDTVAVVEVAAGPVH